jgi:spoIIIJ-associated protein
MDEKSRDARQSAEYSARTVADALKRAAEEFGVSSEELDYEIVKDSSHSILGFVRTGEVVIRVHPPVRGPEGTETQIPEPEAPEIEEPEEEVPLTVTKVASTSKGNAPDLERISCDVVATLLDKMGILAAVEVVDRGGATDPITKEVAPLLLNIVGDDLGMLIGRRGETLRDLQFITRLIVSRKVGAWPNVVLDVEGYKTKRVDTLQALAQRMAEQVRKTKHAIVLEPMPAHERRIIHLALRDDPDVYTESTGEDEERKVQIFPK